MEFFSRKVGSAVTAVAICAAVCWCAPMRAQRLSDSSLEELLDAQVTSVSKKEQSLARTAAAVFVVTAEDIRRSGATNIPDILRMVPGVNVARIDSHTWAISVRGLNDRFADKVLVLIDGRSVYTPLTSGVNWDQQDVPIEDIERIEVIRGPGGTVWGANAVKGVINITTKSAAVTRGGLVTGSGGNQEERGLSQYGRKAGPGAYRVFANYSNIENSSFPAASAEHGRAADGGHILHGGFRSDWTLSPQDTLTIQGDVAKMGAGQTITAVFSNALPLVQTLNDPVTADSANILGRWNRGFADGSEMSLQVYYDRSNRTESGLTEMRHTEDVDFHHHLTAGMRHDLVWGAGYRFTGDHISAGYSAAYSPDYRNDNLFSTFAQDEIRLTDSMSVTVGSKFEHNGYTGFEFQPSAQFVWAPTGAREVWFSAARAIRQPSRSDTDLTVNYTTVPVPRFGTGVVRLTGNPNWEAERVYSYQLGYRTQIGRKLSVDAAAFLDLDRGIRTVEPLTPYIRIQPSPVLIIPFTFENLAHSHSYGGEVFANWKVKSYWKLSPGYSMIRVFIDHDAQSLDTTSGLAAYNTPQHEFQIRSSLTLPRNVEWDASVAYTGRLHDYAAGNMATPHYTRADIRLAKRIGESLEVSVVGQNLLDARHVEFHDSFAKFHTVVGRNVFARFTWTY